jgi:secondary thiamine-phosphate synthase enzyme
MGEVAVQNGLCNVFVPHTTASVIISENWDPDVTTDTLTQLERIVPREAGYKHSEGNSQAHILSAMFSPSLNLPVQDGKLAIGRWQAVVLAEFDGPRERSVYVSVIPCA